MPQAPTLLPTWNKMIDDLRDLAPRLLEKLPTHLRDDPQTQQEVGRLLLEALIPRAIDAVARDGDHPMFLPAINVVMNIYQPNADTVYRQAEITPGGSYRLRGRKGSLRIASLGMFGPFKNGLSGPALGYYDLNSLKEDEHGNFDVLMSPEKPQGYSGQWWRLEPTARNLLLRQVAFDWATERDPVIAIERVDTRPQRPRPDAAGLDKRLGGLAADTFLTASMLIGHVEQLRQEGYVNKFKQWDVGANHGGLVGQFYYEGIYQLDADEALVIETDYPESCEYASLILTNEIFETIDWYNNHSSLNATQWRRDSDGKLRVVISAKDPGLHNWLDTSGYPTGVVQGRWTNCSSTPMPSARRMAVADARSQLPPDTALVSPEQRDRIIRDRRAHLQQRILW